MGSSPRPGGPGAKCKCLKDGDGLFLAVSPSGAKWFEFRYRLFGKDSSFYMYGIAVSFPFHDDFKLPPWKLSPSGGMGPGKL